MSGPDTLFTQLAESAPWEQRQRFGLRPRGGGTGRWITLEGGDLLIMGGRSQHEWEHAVPKAVRGGPRISVTYRHTAPDPAA